MSTTVSRTQKAARTYLERGWCAIPVPARTKNPNRKGWESERYEPADVSRVFRANGNIGLHCGEPSNGLVDIDLDCPEARILAPEFLPTTGRVHGRASAPRSHWWYVCDPIPSTRKFRDDQRRSLIEIRSTGAQTIVPPSVHPEGEEIVWESTGEAAEIDGRVLEHQVSRLAACTLLARHWDEGSRHDLALAVSGALLRHGWDLESTVAFIEAASRAGGDVDQLDEHRQAVIDTQEAIENGDEATGIPTLIEILDEKVARRFLDWLGIQQTTTTSVDLGSRTRVVVGSNGKHEPPAPAVETEPAEWSMPDNAPSIDVSQLPYWLERIVRHIEPFTPMFPPEWPVMMTLPFWSMLWPQVRIQNLNLALWTLGVGRQGGGKNIATDELERLTKAILQGDIKMYTAGSPEGLWEALEGNGKRVLAYHDEYAGLLKLFSRDHMSHAKEALCSLYDGRGVGYLRTKGKSVQITDPVLAVVATTTPSALREYGNTSDLTNGYLSRFMVCAPNRRNVSPDFSFANDMERAQLARELAEHRSNLYSVSRVEYAETGRADPPTINAYRQHLGIDTGEYETLEDALDDNSIPGGRLLARVKKVAALLALGERPPRTASGGLTVLIEESHIRMAIDIVELGFFYANRVLSWIGESQDVQLSAKIISHLKAHPYGLSRRDLCRRTKAKASEVQDALRLLREEGSVISAKERIGNSGERWVLVSDGR